MLRPFFLVLLTIYSSLAFSTELARLTANATNQQLWHDNYWLKLNHYTADSDSASGYTSQVDDKKFFISREGKSNPKEELLATLQAFYATNISDDAHALCRYPARLAWLKQTLAIPNDSLPSVNCALYDEWRTLVQGTKLTLVFPAYHLNSPSSMFGHTLLRLDKDNAINDSKWLAFAVNFGADVSAEDNSILYAFKGLSGGYPGIFIVTPYFKKIQEYSRIERRDIWEYELNFTADEVDRLVLHLWELKEIRFDYYFFDENCSYRLLELLEVARPSLDLTSEFIVTAIPVDTVKSVERADLITNKIYRPAEVTKLEYQIKHMDERSQAWVIRLTDDAAALDQNEFIALPIAKQRLYIDAAYRYLRYQQRGKTRDTEIAERSHRLLLALNQLPPTELPSPPAPISPEHGHDSKRIWISSGRENSDPYTDVGFRMSFHSLEDNEDGFLRGAQINIMSGELRYLAEQDKLLINQLDFVDIFSITPRSRFFSPWTWRIKTGADRHHEQTDKQAAHVTGGGGVAYSLTENGVFYSLARLRMEHSAIEDANPVEFAVGYDVGILYHFEASTAHIESFTESHSHDRIYRRTSYQHNFIVKRNHAIALNYALVENRIDTYHEAGFSYRIHF